MRFKQKRQQQRTNAKLTMKKCKLWTYIACPKSQNITSHLTVSNICFPPYLDTSEAAQVQKRHQRRPHFAARDHLPGIAPWQPSAKSTKPPRLLGHKHKQPHLRNVQCNWTKAECHTMTYHDLQIVRIPQSSGGVFHPRIAAGDP